MASSKRLEIVVALLVCINALAVATPNKPKADVLGCVEEKHIECLKLADEIPSTCESQWSNNECCPVYEKVSTCLNTYVVDCYLDERDRVLVDDALARYNENCLETTSGANCFPASASVELETGTSKSMQQLEIGDRVRVQADKFEEVFSFSHRQASGVHTFLAIQLEKNAIELTPGHLLPIGDRLIPASKVQIGDILTLSDGSLSRVLSVERVRRTGLYNPHTSSGLIAVNGVSASTFTSTVPPTVAKLLLKLPEMLYRLGVSDPLFGLLNHDLPSWVHSLLPFSISK